MFNILKYYKFFFCVSGIILLFGIISLSVYHLKLGIDFKGGSQIQLQFNQPFDISNGWLN
jgi:preprotein translocase subunit SecF